jgi:transcriptional regulator with XRE-family HTH domain
MHDIGEKIRAAREGKGLSRRAFADLVGISEPKVQAIETGKQRIDHETLYNIAKSANLDVRWLLSLEQTPVVEASQHSPVISPKPTKEADNKPIDPLRLMICGNVVADEYRRAEIELSQETHFLEAVWVYNWVQDRMPDPTDGVAMEAALREVRGLVRKRLGERGA